MENDIGVIYRRGVEPQPEAPRPDVVRPLSRAAARTCARPGCPSPASSTLTFRYDPREVLLEDLADEREPESYDLCAGHAERTGPPHGWRLDDRRSDRPDGPSGAFGGERTVALIARMLGRDRDGPVTAERPSPGQGRPTDGPGDADRETRANAW